MLSAYSAQAVIRNSAGVGRWNDVRGCSILLGAAAAFIFHCSVPVVYVILMSDEIIKLPFTIKRFFSYKWLKDVTRDNLADVS